MVNFGSSYNKFIILVLVCMIWNPREEPLGHIHDYLFKMPPNKPENFKYLQQETFLTAFPYESQQDFMHVENH